MRSTRFSGWYIVYALLFALALFLIYAQERSIVSVFFALIIPLLILRGGIAMLGSLAQPLPEPPPPGELRKVKIQFRCDVCGTEVRMTAANDEIPEPPRHCMEDMLLVTPTFD
jgi:hypothetical protein